MGQAGMVKNLADGIIWVQATDFVLAFCQFEISAMTDNFTNNYLEILSDDGTSKMLTFTLATASPVWIGANYYTTRMYP
jgi:hypothetical protein